ncbi:hypothetical protein KDL29_15310 [bacterium]|nr:hypothetical protein [bacterium]
MQRLRIAMLMLCLLPVLATAQEEPAASAHWSLPAPDPETGYLELQLPPDGYCGLAPGDDWLAKDPELPDYEGWYRYIDGGSRFDAFIADEKHIAYTNGWDINLLDAASGALLWQQDYASDFYRLFPNGTARLDKLFLADKLLVYEWRYKTEARSLEDGQLLWTADYEDIFGIFDGYVWVGTHSPDVNQYGEPDVLRALDPLDGEVLGQWQLTPIKQFSRPGDGGGLVVRSESQLYRFNGLEDPLAIPLPQPELHAVIYSYPQGILLVGQPKRDDLIDFSLDWFPAGGTEAVISLRHLAKEAHTRDRFYVLDLDVRSFYYASIGLVDSMLLLVDESGLRRFDIDSGKELAGLGKADGWPGGVLLGSNDNMVLATINIGDVDENGHQDSYFAMLDPRSLSISELPASLELSDWTSQLNSRNLLIANGRPYTPSPRNTEIISVKIGANGQPLPGRMQALSWPPLHDELLARFLASADPLADRELMGEIISGGLNAQEQLLNGTAGTDAVHMDALALANFYMHQSENMNASRQEFGSYGSVTSGLLRVLQNLNSEASLPSLLRWQEMPLFAGQLIELREAISNCGAAGASYLAANDEFGYSGLHVQAPGFYPVREDNFELYGGGDRHVSIPGWAEVHSGTPDRIAVFTSPGLYDDRDIYIGFDPVEGQGFRHVLPTGLVDRVSHWNSNLAPTAWLSLRDAGDGGLTVLHNRLKPDADLEQYPIVDPVLDYVEIPLSLEDVQRDSDGDGLTDIAERLLLLDPANPDCDDDGIPDGSDCTPNADAAAMGPVERGIARALAMYWPEDGSGSNHDWVASVETGSPWQARYFTVYNSGPVAFARSAGEYSICLDGSSNERLNNGDANRWEWPENSITMEWIDRRADPIEGYKRSRMYQYYIDEGREFTEDELREKAESWQQYAGFYYYDPERESDEAGPDAVLDLDFPYHGEVILFRLVDGEYWPYHKRGTWVS